MRELIKKILKEETQIDLSPKIKELLEDSVQPNHKMICKIDVVAPWKLVGHNSTSDYQVMVSVIGGSGSKNWPMTQFVHNSRDKIVNDVWRTVYDYMGIPTDVFLRNVKSCDEVMSEESKKQEHKESEITERCWKGYTQKGMKTMFGKRYPNCVKIKKKKMNESEIPSQWNNSDNKLTRKFKFSDYEETLDFVNKVAKIAQKQNHHPDITFGYNTVKVSITDHEKGGVSEKCHKFTKAVDSI